MLELRAAIGWATSSSDSTSDALNIFVISKKDLVLTSIVLNFKYVCIFIVQKKG